MCVLGKEGVAMPGLNKSLYPSFLDINKLLILYFRIFYIQVKLVSTNLELVQERKKVLSMQNQITKIQKEIQLIGSTIQV